jgi:hypothetical protein
MQLSSAFPQLPPYRGDRPAQVAMEVPQVRRSPIRKLAAMLLLTGCFGCAKEPPDPAIPAPYKEIVRIAAEINTAHESDSVFCVQANKLIDKIENPNVLAQLASAFRNYDHRKSHDGRCVVCERLNDAADHCLARLAELGTDAAATELVRLCCDEQSR